MTRIALALVGFFGLVPVGFAQDGTSHGSGLAVAKVQVLCLVVEKVPEALYAHLPSLRSGQGILVTQVLAGFPGAEAGIQRHDILVSLSGTPIQDIEHFSRLLTALGNQKT